MAKLYFNYGAMNSGKTAKILLMNYNYKEIGQNPLLLKPKADGDKIISSRIGISSPCLFIEDIENENIDNFFKLNHYDVIITDESQFLSEKQVEMLTYIVDYLNIPVICFGLRTDFQGELFSGSKALLTMADVIEEHKCMCWCGKKATHNARIDKHGNMITKGTKILKGGNNVYVSICRKHFKEEKTQKYIKL